MMEMINPPQFAAIAIRINWYVPRGLSMIQTKGLPDEANVGAVRDFNLFRDAASTILERFRDMEHSVLPRNGPGQKRHC